MLGIAQVGLNRFTSQGRVEFTLADQFGLFFFLVLNGFQKPFGLLVAAFETQDALQAFLGFFVITGIGQVAGLEKQA
jgi:hypothetical protein